MLVASWQLSLLFIFVTPVVAMVVSLVSKRFRLIAKRIQDAMGSNQGIRTNGERP